MSIFFEQYEALCRERGFSPNAAAAQMGIPSGSVTAWKRGVVPRVATVQKIAAFFGISGETLLQGGASPRLRSVARLEGADITPEQDAEIANFIDFLLRKKDG